MIAQHVFEAWRADILAREPRALELAYALELALPPDAQSPWWKDEKRLTAQMETALSADVRELMQSAYARYAAFRQGNFQPVDLGNPNLFAFERVWQDERLLIVNNLARVPQFATFRGYAGRAGWDILNRIEFVFPPRAQLEAYEFIWLMVDEKEKSL